MQAEQLTQAIADAWDGIVRALGDERTVFESRLTPLLRQLEGATGPEQAEIIRAILALFQEFKRAQAALTGPRTRNAVPTKGASEILSSGAVPRRERHSVVQVFYGTDRVVTGPANAPTSYGVDRGEFALGIADVSIPDDHRMGKVERPSIWKLEFRENRDKHVVVLKLQPLSAEDFQARASAALGKSSKKEVLLFVHGYNVTFPDAVMRTAQIAFDLHFEGIPALYSWPSEGSMPRYMIDEANVTWSKPRFAAFLTMLREKLGADTIHIIAHSMGNRLVTETIAEMASPAANGAAKIRQVVFAAPDLDAATFKDLAARFHQKAERFTLYASSNDKALQASKAAHKYPRAGESGASLLVLDPIDTIDASAIDTSFLGHSYYGDNRSVVTDLFELIRRGSPPPERAGLRAMTRFGVPYWEFSP